MASKLAEAYVEIRSENSHFLRGMSAVRNTLTSTLSFVGSMGVKLATVSGGLLAAGSTWGVALAANAEQSEIAFTTFLKSGEKAKAFLAELRSFADATPFADEEIIQAGKKMLAYGFDVSTVTGHMTRLGDVSSGLAVPLGDLIDIFGKARSQGRLMGDDILQLSGRGVPIVAELAKQFGVSESQVSKLVEQGKVGFPNLQRAIESMTNAGGLFAGGMEAQSKSLAGLFSTLKAKGMFALETLGKAIIEQFDLKKLTADLTEWTSYFTTDIVPQIVSGMATAVERIKGFWSAAQPFLTSIWDEVGVGIRIATGLWNAAVPVVSTLFGWMVKIRETVRSEILPVLQEWLDKGVEIYQNFSAGISDLLSYIMQIWGDTFAWIGTVTGSAFNGALKWVKGFVDEALDLISIFTADFGLSWDLVTQSAALSISEFSDNFWRGIQTITTVAKAGFAYISEIMTGTLQNMMASWSEFSQFIQAIVVASGAAFAALGPGGESPKEAFARAFDEAASKFEKQDRVDVTANAKNRFNQEMERGKAGINFGDSDATKTLRSQVQQTADAMVDARDKLRKDRAIGATAAALPAAPDLSQRPKRTPLDEIETKKAGAAGAAAAATTAGGTKGGTFSGVAEFSKAIQTAALKTGDKAAAETAKNTKEAVKEQKQTNKKLDDMASKPVVAVAG